MVKSRLGWTRLTRITDVNDEIETFQDVEIKPWQSSKAKKTPPVCDFLEEREGMMSDCISSDE